ncbi:hypothetical protein AK830_g1801 [Neonectria ditissima]|uniref:Uncharacterized protein n=1 Tax=Neonectria ditissima TaxID=78410 RepID=A0A0P7BD79_9HYPO|nr:hypothetical protein AK830_g1801 [Neonectria ditissima]
MRSSLALLSTLLAGAIASSPALQVEPRAIDHDGLEERDSRKWEGPESLGVAPFHHAPLERDSITSPRVVESLNLEVPTGPFHDVDPKVLQKADVDSEKRREDSLHKEERTAHSEDNLGRMEKRSRRRKTKTPLREIIDNNRAYRAQRKADKAQHKADRAQKSADVAWRKAGFGGMGSGKDTSYRKSEFKKVVRKPANRQTARAEPEPATKVEELKDEDREVSLGYRIKVKFQNNGNEYEGEVGAGPEKDASSQDDDNNGTNKKGTDKKGTDRKATDKKGTHHKCTHRKGTDNKGPDDADPDNTDAVKKTPHREPVSGDSVEKTHDKKPVSKDAESDEEVEAQDGGCGPEEDEAENEGATEDKKVTTLKRIRVSKKTN